MPLDDYKNLIPAPNIIMPKFMAWLSAIFQPAIDTQQVNTGMISAFDIQQAIGIQLDTLGVILGLPRIVNFTPSLGASPILDDDTYRIILLAKIIRNQWKGTKQEIYTFWQKFFPQFPLIIQDNQDMSMTVIVIGTTLGIIRDLVLHGYFVPKPAGVRINYVFPDVPLFAWGIETDFLKGWGEGYWSPGPSLSNLYKLNFTRKENSQYLLLGLG